MNEKDSSFLEDPFKIEVWSLLVGFIMATMMLSVIQPEFIKQTIFFPSPFTRLDLLTYATLIYLLILFTNMFGKFCILGAILVTNKLVALTKSKEEVRGDEIGE